MADWRKLGNIRNGYLRWTIGVSLILAGILGGVVPVLQGWALILTGLFVINSRWTKEQYENLRKRFKK